MTEEETVTRIRAEHPSMSEAMSRIGALAMTDRRLHSEAITLDGYRLVVGAARVSNDDRWWSLGRRVRIAVKVDVAAARRDGLAVDDARLDRLLDRWCVPIWILFARHAPLGDYLLGGPKFSTVGDHRIANFYATTAGTAGRLMVA